MILWHGLQLHKVCRKLKAKYNFKYDINVIRSDLIYARILEQASKRSSYKTASEFLENTTKKFHQRLIITYSPKYALYQKTIWEKQVERAQKMLESGSTKKNRKNPNDPARFIGTTGATEDGEAADIHNYLNENKIYEESLYDGLYVVCTDLLEDEVANILKVSEGRWQIEECFRIMKTDFSARPVYRQDENRIKAHFLICFLALTIYRYLEKKVRAGINYHIMR